MGSFKYASNHNYLDVSLKKNEYTTITLFSEWYFDGFMEANMRVCLFLLGPPVEFCSVDHCDCLFAEVRVNLRDDNGELEPSLHVYVSATWVS